jgi:WD40 repeat protein
MTHAQSSSDWAARLWHIPCACWAAVIVLAGLLGNGMAEEGGELVAGPPTVLKHPQINESVGNPVHCLTFLNGGELLATGATSGVLIWETSSGKLRETLELDERAVDSIALAPRRGLLVAGGASGIIKVWNAKSFELLHTFGPTPGAVRGLAISPDEKILASTSPFGQKGAYDREFAVLLWDLATGEPVRTIPHPPSAFGMTAIVFANGGQIITAQDRALRILDTARGEVVQTIDLPALPRSLGCIALHPGGERLASGVFEPKIRVWDRQTWKELRAWDAHHEEAPPRQGVVSLAWSPDGKYLLSGGMDGMASVWEPSTGRRLLRLDARDEGSSGRVTGVALSADGSLFAASHFGGSATIWRIRE